MILTRGLSPAFAFPLRVRVASRSEAGIETVKPLSSLIAYDCSLKNESPVVANDGAVYRDETVLVRRCAATHSFHKRQSTQNRDGDRRIRRRERTPLHIRLPRFGKPRTIFRRRLK